MGLKNCKRKKMYLGEFYTLKTDNRGHFGYCLLKLR